MKKKKLSNWVIKQHRDIYFKSSKLENYRSRAAYKLIEINDKFNIFKDRKLVLDLGASPGSWSQVVKKIVPDSTILSVDAKLFKQVNNSPIIIGDFTKQETKKKIFDFFKKKIDVVLSDMASDTTGIKNLDSIRTGELSLEALNFSPKILKENGIFISKIFMGSIFEELKKRARYLFNEFKFFKPKSSRIESKEIYIVCKRIKKYL